ncbi:MAG: 30S ribosomal protein S12 methylthiotransferase RimO [Spirochaetes bacterium]|nr:30S ribosomal protein S12 methylthiotransferase RimO [Spirochaetota bacterium]
MKLKVGLISLGCPKNLVDSEIMLGILNEAAFEITNDKAQADILIVNTCGFIDSAKKESIDAILEMADCKKGKCELLIVAGCLAERYRNQLAKSIPEIDALIGTGGYADIVKVIKEAYSSGKAESFPEQVDISYLNNRRIMSSDKGYAYLKIAEGCDNRCSYCVIPSLRGRYRSRRIEDIVKEAKILAALGKKEIILVSQDTTRYGIDLYKRQSLVKLIKKLSVIKGIEWIRLLYCYPEGIKDELIEEMKNNEKLCKYLDIPIQHISWKILKAMGRRGTGRDIEELIVKLRREVPEIVLRTSLIVGFPGESEADFKMLYDFVKHTEFDRLGVFTYSQEEGTKAALMKGQIQKRIKNKRYKSITKLQSSINNKKNSKRIGAECTVIIDGLTDDGKFYYGRTYGEAPDIDWLVFFASNKALKTGDIVFADIAGIE